MQSLKDRFARYTDRLALTHPAAWIYGWTAAGIATGLALYSLFGAALGWAFGSPMHGAQAGQAIYAFWFATNVEGIKTNAEAVIASLREVAQCQDIIDDLLR